MARRPPPRPAAPQPTPRELLLRSWAGRTFLAAASLKFVFAIWRTLGDLPEAARLVSGAATIALAVALAVFVWRLSVQVKRRLLWQETILADASRHEAFQKLPPDLRDLLLDRLSLAA